MELMKRRARKEKRKRDRERKKPALVCFALFCFAPLAWGTLQRDRQSNTETTPFLTFIITVIPLTEMFNRGA